MQEANLKSRSNSIPPVRLEQAKTCFEQAVNFMKLQQYPEAKRFLKNVLKIIPQHPNSHQLLSVIAAEQGDFSEALQCIKTAITYQPQNLDFYYNRAMLYQRLHKQKLAIVDLEHIIALNPSHYLALLTLARIFHSQKSYPQAAVYYEKALTLVNTDTSVWNDLTAVYVCLEQFSKALKCNEVSLYLDGNNAENYAIQGGIYERLSKFEEAIQAYRQALQLKPDLKTVLIPLFMCKNRVCDWEHYAESLRLLKEKFSLVNRKNNELPTSLFEVLSLDFLPQDLYKIAQLDVALFTPGSSISGKRLSFNHVPHRNKRLRIAYISSSFRDFPTGHLTQDLYATHDRSHFEVFVYSYGKDDDSIYRKKIEEGCDHFVDISHDSIEQACEKIAADKIDILVDLMGNTRNARLGINALRPAPINVRYLGAASTTGASFFDYFISDSFITPASEQAHFSENLVLMPHTYQVNPLDQAVSPDVPSRAECGLPETGIVFCAFNNTYKIEPIIFQSWMNILQAVPDSVLWLQASGTAQTNLVQSAQNSGIAADRLVFATHMPKDRHLARHLLADLYLDTHIYNAHTTASDALWMNVPVLTCPGLTFQSRVAGSLLNALGMNELIMPDLETYEKKAIALALDPKGLKRLKTKLKKHRQSYPLFDTKRFVRDLEKAYGMMWKNYQQHKKSMIVVPEEGAL